MQTTTIGGLSLTRGEYVGMLSGKLGLMGLRSTMLSSTGLSAKARRIDLRRRTMAGIARTREKLSEDCETAMM